MKKRMLMWGMAALLLPAMSFGDVTVEEEDFEAYTAGGDITTATGLSWTVVSTAADGVARVEVDATDAAGKAAYFEDLGGIGVRYGATSPALDAYNGGKGIEKGYIQYDKLALGAAAANSIVTLRFYETWHYLGTGDSWDATKQLGYVHFNCGASAPLVVNLNNGANTPSPNPWIFGNEYRVKLSFDIPAKLMSVQIYDGADFTNLWWQSAEIPTQTTSTIVGVKGVAFDSPSNTSKNPKYQIDNIKFVDTSITVPAPEVAISVDSVDVANGGTIDFGKPAVDEVTSRIVTVTNTGDAPLTTSALLVTGDRFALNSGETLLDPIPANDSDTIEIEMNTAAPPGIYTGALTFTTDDADEPSVSINLTGDVGNTSVQDWQER